MCDEGRERARDRICVVRSHSIKDGFDLRQPFGCAPPPLQTSASPADLPSRGSGEEKMDSSPLEGKERSARGGRIDWLHDGGQRTAGAAIYSQCGDWALWWLLRSPSVGMNRNMRHV